MDTQNHRSRARFWPARHQDYAHDKLDSKHNASKETEHLLLAAGGSRNKGASVLTRLHALHEAQQELAVHEAALQQAQGSLKSMAASAATYKR